MPIYEYQCTACDAVTDIKHGFKEPMNEVCPACAGTLKRVFRPAGIVFKGSGFYVTDSRKAAESRSSATGKSDAVKGETAKGEPAGAEPAKGESKGDSTPSEPSKGDASKSDSAKTEAPKSGDKKGDAAA